MCQTLKYQVTVVSIFGILCLKTSLLFVKKKKTFQKCVFMNEEMK